MLSQIRGPADLQHLSQSQLDDLALEIREFLIHKVAATGGHLGPNLGVVELTLALHRVFDSPHDPIIFDTGHQAYVHKMLTGRCPDFDNLRKKGGLSGYPSRSESEHDWVESSHASTALSYADGLAKAFELSGHRNRHVVAVVGDGALTGGMCWEALNNIAAARRPVIIVVNDNGRSYAPTIGGFADHLAGLRLQPGYERAARGGPQGRARRAAHRRVLLPVHAQRQGRHQGRAGAAGDVHRPRASSTSARSTATTSTPSRPRCATPAGSMRRSSSTSSPARAWVTRPAETDEAEQMHSTGIIDPQTGLATSVAAPGWTSVFSDELIKRAAKRRDIVAITAAMPGPTGLSAFRKRFPDRFFDVGIAEQHAMTSAAGLAMGGMHPVVAIYSTFLNRAFDQMMMDVALHKLPVTMVLDRAGVTGPDGASHNGMWDMSMLGIVPGMRVAAPRDAARLREELGEALDVKDGPTAIRFPKGDVGEDIPAVERRDGVDVLAVPADGLSAGRAAGGGRRVRVDGAVGRRAAAQPGHRRDGRRPALGAAGSRGDRRARRGPQAGRHRRGQRRARRRRVGGVGGAARAEIDVPCRDVGVPQEFLDHASRGEVLTEVGLTDQNIARQITGWVAALGSSVGEPHVSDRVDVAASRLRSWTPNSSAGGPPARYFDYLGFDIFYRVDGSPRPGPGAAADPRLPVQLLGLGADLADAVERFTVIAPDMIGMGFSDKPVAYEYSVHDHADMHEALLRHLGVDSCHVLAHDLGDSVGQELLARYEAGDNAYGAPIIESITWLNGGLFNEATRPRLLQKLMSRTPLGDMMSRLQGSSLSRRIMDRTLDQMFGPEHEADAAHARALHEIMDYNDGARVTAQGRQVRHRPVRAPQPLGAGDAGDQCADAADRRADRPELGQAHGRPLPAGDPRSGRRHARRRRRALAADRGSRRGLETLPGARRRRAGGLTLP